jgi:hypothetical protein
MASGEMRKTEFTGFLSKAFRNLAAFSVDGSLHYVCMDWRHLEELLAAGREAYSELTSLSCSSQGAVPQAPFRRTGA